MDLCPDEIRHKKIIKHQNKVIFNTRKLESEIENITKNLQALTSRLETTQSQYSEPDPLFVGDIVRVFDSTLTFENQIRGRVLLINRNPELNYYIIEISTKYPEGIIHHIKSRRLLHFVNHSSISETEIATILGSKLARTDTPHLIE